MPSKADNTKAPQIDVSASDIPGIDVTQGAVNIIEPGISDQKAAIETAELKSVPQNGSAAEPSSNTPTIENLSVEEQVAQLQASLLNDEDFDLNQLEAPAAGQNDASIGPLSESLADLGKLHVEPGFSNSNTSPDTSVPGAPTPLTSPLTDSNNTLSTMQENTLLASETLRESNANQSVIHRSVTEDFQISISGKLDAVLGASGGSIETGSGRLDYNSDGTWQYQLNNQLQSVQQLGAGDVLQETVTLVAQDGGRHQVEITINGTNDRPIVSGDKRASIEEAGDQLSPDTELTAKGTLLAEDIDAGESRFKVEFGIETSYGSANIDGQGNWTYTLDNQLQAVKSLGEGQQLSDTFITNTLDGTAILVKINIIGANNSPQIDYSSSEYKLAEHQNVYQIELANETSIHGKLGIQDTDFGESAFQAAEGAASEFGLGYFSLDSEGNWHYELDTGHSKIQNLGEGLVTLDLFRFKSLDGTEAELVVKIIGSDNPVFNKADTPLIDISNDDAILAASETGEQHAEPDLYVWQPDTANHEEAISGFSPGEGGDTLHFSELLSTEHTTNDLDAFLHFSYDGENTTIEIRPESSLAGEPHLLVMNNLDLTSFGNSDLEIINQLISNGNLDIEGIA